VQAGLGWVGLMQQSTLWLDVFQAERGGVILTTMTMSKMTRTIHDKDKENNQGGEVDFKHDDEN
jgi:hypothetical protein